MAKVQSGAKKPSRNGTKAAARFEPVKLDSLFEVLDAVAWVEGPTCTQIAQFAGIDPRTAGKLLKNGTALGVLDSADGEVYLLRVPYPYKGSVEQKSAVVKEALIRMPILRSMRQFIRLGENYESAMRKAATVTGHSDYDPKLIAPLVAWATKLDALNPSVDVDQLVDKASEAKAERHLKDSTKRVAFISHSSKDKPFVRQLVSDLTAEGVKVWLDEQRILVGDSIPEKISQGLAESDIFLVVLSEHSVSSEWVKRELNSALVSEISKRKVKIMPLKLSDCEIPAVIHDKKFADFSGSYKTGLDELLAAIRNLEILNDAG